jgi:serine/threonine-protein kinase
LIDIAESPRAEATRREVTRSVDGDFLPSADYSLVNLLESHGGRPSRPSRAAREASPLPAPAADPLIGMVLADRYRILEPIGRGGMGIVYKVEHTRIGKLLAMKLLTGELSRNPEVVRRFKREALTASLLQSPNTVQVFDFGVSEGLTYLVMELVSGHNLGSILRAEGPMPFARLGKLVIQVCSSLAEAHRKGIVHRDIKPENLMLLSAGDGTELCKVLDFGLAKLRETEALNDITSQGTVLGTPYYMAPEQIGGEPVDARTDVYSVGALMYRVLTGQHVFSGPPMTVLSKHLGEAPIPPAERAPELGIPPGVSRLVMKALRKLPADRFQHVEELQQCLLEEVRAAGSASVESLLDAGALRRLARSAEGRSGDLGLALPVATRDEVDAYERGLRRTRVGLAGVVAALALTGVAAASFALHHDASFTGAEIEPNDTAAQATDLPLGKPITGRLGKRLDESRGDRDFYAIDLPPVEGAPGAQATLRLRVSALPNLATCTMLYKPGFPDALGQYCVGRPGRDLVIPGIQLEPGRYLLAVLQDVESYGGAPTYIHESISDTYTVLAESAAPEAGTEIEPNDRLGSATHLGLSVPVSGVIGWIRDEDVYCIAGDVAAKVRWKLRSGFRESGVLEATPIVGGDEGVPVRVHADARGKAGSMDAVSPWRSAAVAGDGVSPRCLRVRLATDPWAPERVPGVPAAGSEPYVVEAEAVP